MVGPASATDVASVSHSDQYDPNLVNNTASASEAPQQADLIVVNTVVARTAPNVGDVITYTVTVTNNGPQPDRDERLACRRRFAVRGVLHLHQRRRFLRQRVR